MIIKNENNTIEFQLTEVDISKPEIFCQSQKKKIGTADVVFDCLKLSFLDKHIKVLNSIFNTLKTKNQSFVFVATPEQFNSVPELLIIVPTVQEAYDFIEFERIQRDLGF